jgi:hypothetical protein
VSSKSCSHHLPICQDLRKGRISTGGKNLTGVKDASDKFDVKKEQKLQEATNCMCEEDEPGKDQ